MSKKRKVKRAAKRTTKRRAYVQNPRMATRRRSYRRNPGLDIVTPVTMAAGAVAGAVLGGKASGFIPIESTLVKNLALVGMGVAAAMLGKKYPAVQAAGVGMAALGGYRAITNAVPVLAGEDDYTQEESESLAASLLGQNVVMGENLLMGESMVMGAPLMGAPISQNPYNPGPFMGAPLAGQALI